MKAANFWTEDYPRPLDLPTCDLPDQADVVIVGSGYTGLHAAIALRRAGASVVVLEQETVGWGASSRNGGMALTGMKLEMPEVFRRYGRELGREFWEWSLASIDHLECTIAEERIDCDFSRTGHILLAAKPKHYDAMAHELEWMKRELDYHDAWLISQESQQAEVGTRAFYGGLADRRSGALHPAKYVFGLSQAAARWGAQLVERTQVTGVARQGSSFAVGTSRGVVAAKEILLATNGYTSGVVPQIRDGIFPIGSYIVVTEPLEPALQDELIPRGRMLFDSKNFLNYFRLTPDGRMLFGGRHDLSTGLDPIESARLMRKRMVEVFPQLHDVLVTHTWSGNLGVTFDLMPHAGRIEGIHYAYGYAGHGVAIGGYLGKEVGEMIAGKRASTPFAKIKHLRTPISRYEKLYLPLVSTWFRALDAVK